METALVTWWSIAHFLTGVVLGLAFRLKIHKKTAWLIPLALIVMIFFRDIGVWVVGATAIGLIILGISLKELAKRKILLNNTVIIPVILIILIGWELFEAIVLGRIPFGQESLRNKISDIVIGFAGFLITYFCPAKKEKS